MDVAAVLILVSGLAHAIVNAILKAGKDKLSGRALIDGSSALLIAPAVIWVALPSGAWGWLAASWAVHMIYLVALVKSFERADMSAAYPIARGIAPTVAAAVSVMAFDEPISLAVGIGIGLVVVGVLCIGAGRRVTRNALMWAVTTGLCIAVYTVIDAQGVRAAPSAESYIVWVFLTMGIGISLLFAFWRGPAFFTAAATQWKPGLIAGALSIVTYGLALYAFRLGATPRLAALRETSILFATVIAVVFLKEQLTRGRLAGIAAIAVGAMVLVGWG
jgi:drug/metabolite transporter (DMT)-like permease